jgi:hypothetical protein
MIITLKKYDSSIQAKIAETLIPAQKAIYVNHKHNQVQKKFLIVIPKKNSVSHKPAGLAANSRRQCLPMQRAAATARNAKRYAVKTRLDGLVFAIWSSWLANPFFGKQGPGWTLLKYDFHFLKD